MAADKDLVETCIKYCDDKIDTLQEQLAALKSGKGKMLAPGADDAEATANMTRTIEFGIETFENAKKRFKSRLGV